MPEVSIDQLPGLLRDLANVVPEALEAARERFDVWLRRQIPVVTGDTAASVAVVLEPSGIRVVINPPASDYWTRLSRSYPALSQENMSRVMAQILAEEIGRIIQRTQ